MEKKCCGVVLLVCIQWLMSTVLLYTVKDGAGSLIKDGSMDNWKIWCWSIKFLIAGDVMNLSLYGSFMRVDVEDPTNVSAVFLKTMNVALTVLSWTVMFNLYL